MSVAPLTPEPTGASLSEYQRLVELMPDPVVLVNEQGQLAFVNQVASELFGYTVTELVGQSVNLLLPEDRRGAHTGLMREYLDQPQRRSLSNDMALAARCKNGDLIDVDIMLQPAQLDGCRYVITVLRDIGHIRRLEQRLQQALEREQQLARIDSLTGAANRRAFHEHLEQEIDRARRYKSSFAIVYIDLDNFKRFNDQHGHSKGDQLLCAITTSLRSNLRPSDVVARLGGDEFALLLPHTSEQEVHHLVDRLHALLTQQMNEAGTGVSFSAGVLLCRKTSLDPDSLITLADNLMYEVKRNNKNAVTYELRRHPRASE